MPAAAKLRWKKVSEASRELATGASQSLLEVGGGGGAGVDDDEAAAATAASARSPTAEAHFEISSVLPLLDTADRSVLEVSK